MVLFCSYVQKRTVNESVLIDLGSEMFYIILKPATFALTKRISKILSWKSLFKNLINRSKNQKLLKVFLKKMIMQHQHYHNRHQSVLSTWTINFSLLIVFDFFIFKLENKNFVLPFSTLFHSYSINKKRQKNFVNCLSF